LKSASKPAMRHETQSPESIHGAISPLRGGGLASLLGEKPLPGYRGWRKKRHAEALALLYQLYPRVKRGRSRKVKKHRETALTELEDANPLPKGGRNRHRRTKGARFETGEKK